MTNGVAVRYPTHDDARMLGRLFCRCGWHKWEFFDLAQRGSAGEPVIIRTYCTCERCSDYGLRIINIELCVEDQSLRRHEISTPALAA